jgi:hypothetical protein
MPKKIKINTSASSPRKAKKKKAKSSLPLTFLVILVAACIFVACQNEQPLSVLKEEDQKSSRVTVQKPVKIELAQDVHHFVDTYCISCHGTKKQKGERQFDGLSTFIQSEDDMIAYREILEQLNLGEMPPEKKSVKQPQRSETKKVISLLTEALTQWDTSHNKDFTVLRRLNKAEYRNTMRDLFGLEDLSSDPAKFIPDDTIDEGFKNIAESQNLSDAHLQEYLKAADKYLEMALKLNKPASPQTFRVQPTEWRAAPTKEKKTPWMYRLATPGKYLDLGCGKKPLSDHLAMATVSRKLMKSGIQEAGYYTFKIKAEAIRRLTHPYNPNDIPADLKQPMQLALYIAYNQEGVAGGGVANRRRVALWDLKDHQQDTYEVTVWMNKGYIPFINWDNGPGSTDWWMRDICRDYHDDIEFRGKEGSAAWHIIGKNAVPGRTVSDVWRGPLLRVHDFAFTGPLKEKAYREAPLFGHHTDPAKAIEVFAQKAFRRALSTKEIKTYTTLMKSAQNQLNKSEQEALIYTFKAILCSPDFLYLKETGNEQGKLQSHEVANRLSYFLWSSMPDQALFTNIDQNNLSIQAQRMLADKKSNALIDGLLDSWLRFDKLGLMRPDSIKYKEYYAFDLEHAMKEETRLFLKYILDNNRPVSDFLNADYTFLNHDLAMHYGITGIDGSHFRKVSLKGNTQRGGLLGHASILTLSANGVETSPIKRGIWVLENVLGTPPPPPPPDVEPLEPDTRGATTLRQRLEKHRNVEACADCHSKIDPYGFPLENYGPTGRHRENYYVRVRSAGLSFFKKSGKFKKQDHGIRYAPGFALIIRKGAAIDGKAKLSGMSTIDDLSGLQTALVKRHDQFSKALTEKLFIYALGRKMTYRDHHEIERIAHLKPIEKYGFRDLILEVVKSKTFTALNK